MLFFAFIAFATMAAFFADRLGAPGTADWPARMRVGLAIALSFTGIDHLLNPERYLPMMPAFVPLHLEIVLFTGLCEIAGAFGLLIPRLHKVAGLMLAIYFVCVFPANIKNAVEGLNVEGLNVEGLPTASWYYWVRLLFQPLVIWWALYSSGAYEWFRRKPARG